MQSEPSREYLQTVTDTFAAKFEQLSKWVNHRYAIGSFREHILSEFLRKRYQKFDVRSGFFKTPDRSSHQHDILIIDRNAAPIDFCEGAFCVIEPSAVLASIEVKSRFRREELDSVFRKAADAKRCNNKTFFAGYFFEAKGTRGWLQRVEKHLESLAKVERTALPDLVCVGGGITVWRNESRLEMVNMGDVPGITVLCDALDVWLYHGRRLRPTDVASNADIVLAFEFDLRASSSGAR